MIGYCPLDEDPIERPRPSREVLVPNQEKRKPSARGEDTECNYCLLYTSPSPRDQRGSRMPSSA